MSCSLLAEFGRINSSPSSDYLLARQLQQAEERAARRDAKRAGIIQVRGFSILSHTDACASLPPHT